MSLKSKLLRMLTWWNGQTLNTQFWTWRNGTRVGEDAEGNIFYQSKDGKRRWVIYNGEESPPCNRSSPALNTDALRGWAHSALVPVRAEGTAEVTTTTVLAPCPW